jgi:hypothetical protein
MGRLRLSTSSVVQAQLYVVPGGLSDVHGSQSEPE